MKRIALVLAGIAMASAITVGVGSTTASAGSYVPCNYVQPVDVWVANGGWAFAGFNIGSQPYLNGSFIANNPSGSAYASGTESISGIYAYVDWLNTSGTTQHYVGWANFQTACCQGHR
jgi:hypothetical protein